MPSITAIAQKTGERVHEMMPTIAPIHCVRELPLELWAAKGVRGMVWDVEGTLGVTGSEKLAPELAIMVEEARAVGIPNHALVTNLNLNGAPKQRRMLLAGWEEQTGADISFYPKEPQHAKPSPFMDLQAMQFFDLDGNQMAAGGDKASADVRAARLAGIENIAWTQPYGDNRHPGDRFIRTPLESILRIEAHRELTPKLKQQLQESKAQAVDLDQLSQGDEAELTSGSYPDGMDRIAGLGIEDVVLDPEVLASLRRPAFRVALESLKNSFDNYGEVPKEHLKAFLFEHGRLTADGLVFARFLCALGIVAVNRSDLSDGVKDALSIGLTTVAYATDAVDGAAARHDKNGATKRGAALDQNVDKMLSVIIDAFPLIRRELISKPDFALTLARELALTAARRPFKKRGIDTKSVQSGKAATTIKAVAQGFSLTVGSRYPITNRRLQHAATLAKLASGLHAPVSWINDYELAQHDALEEERQNALGALMLAT